MRDSTTRGGLAEVNDGALANAFAYRFWNSKKEVLAPRTRSVRCRVLIACAKSIAVVCSCSY
jgi:hypothetical protein